MIFFMKAVMFELQVETKEKKLISNLSDPALLKLSILKLVLNSFLGRLFELLL